MYIDWQVAGVLVFCLYSFTCLCGRGRVFLGWISLSMPFPPLYFFACVCLDPLGLHQAYTRCGYTWPNVFSGTLLTR